MGLLTRLRSATSSVRLLKPSEAHDAHVYTDDHDASSDSRIVVGQTGPTDSVLEQDSTLAISSVPPLPARFRPLIIPDVRAGPPSWLLGCLTMSWVLHMLAILPLLTAFTLQRFPQFGFRTTLRLIAYTSIPVIVLVEFALRLARALTLPAIVVLQSLKCVAWTLYNPYFLFATRLEGYYRSYLPFSDLGSATSYALFACSLIIYLKQRKHRTSLLHSRSLRLDDPLDQNTFGAIDVNQATSLVHQAPTVMRLLVWLNDSISSTQEALTTRDKILAWITVCFRYAAVSAFSCFCMTVSSYLPGEPAQPIKSSLLTEADREIFADPDYALVHLPSTRRTGTDLNVGRANENDRRRLPSLRSATSLHTLQDSTYMQTHNFDLLDCAPCRQSGPRHLCFLKQDGGSGATSFTTIRVDEWRDRNSGSTNASYVFVSYTRKQFFTQIKYDPAQEPAQFDLKRTLVAKHQSMLTDYGVQAARNAGADAFWVDFECLTPDQEESPDELIEDVYRICDIVRGAHSLAIVVGPPLEEDSKLQEEVALPTRRAAWLRQWGSRLWTVPEGLLSPSEHRIAIHFSGSDDVEMVAKRNLASLLYDDADAMQKLIDHYEGSVSLTPLQFMSLALRCLQRRQTEKRAAGDVIYALMGLLPQRPRVNKDDSDFQAFARLSLANDSHMLLERMISLVPSSADAPWHDLSDLWNAQIWDIEPLCSVAEISGRHTVSLGNMHGAMINWSCLQPVTFNSSATHSNSDWRNVRSRASIGFAFFCIPLTLGLFLQFIIAVAEDDRKQDNEVLDRFILGLKVVGVTLYALFGLISFYTPLALLRLQKGDIQEPHARYFGCEGIPDLERVEQLLFGSYHGQIMWNDNQVAPTSNTSAGWYRLTIIDTLSLTATVFSAVRIPELVMISGRERGMLRALLCSYDWNTGVLRREATMRVESTTLERMKYMPRAKFSITRTKL